MEVPYTATREETLASYIAFITNIVNQHTVSYKKANYLKTSNDHQSGESLLVQPFLSMLVCITRKRVAYLKLKFKCFEILFHGYSFSRDVLKEELKRIFSSLASTFLRQGLGMSSYSIMELYHILQLLIDFNNTELINDLKLELTGLLLIRDNKTVDYVRILLKKMFTSK
ncbi:uncharacterized protein VICG_01876 [Vittaforma corneae ATCC 50505]|uniref:Uncharacterized protein n=1 Tax=Vittaforma corneae (strain ATCC 50505) TaxID=993615 RepID=L2GJP8_VITCO|nr:uncharacterized protein VICG_01876 [Vittaforma corneae ATCC 50505]ELA41083.1 hypothetical protein VICG_01876 [Vittaforma corneae ATCC 50505]